MEAIFYLVLVLVAYSFLAPKPPAPKQPALEDLDVPTAEEGKPIAVVFGTVWMKSPNVIWYGGLKTTPIKKSGGK